MLKKWFFLPILSLPLPFLISCSQSEPPKVEPGPDAEKITISFQEQSLYNFGNSSEDALDSKFDEQWIKTTVINNKEQIFKLEKGSWTDVNLEQNLIIKIIKKQDGQINFHLSIRGLIEQPKLITFNGFKVNFLSSDGATINGLKIDRYAQVIQLLDLNPFSDWTKLNSDFFKAKLTNDYANLNLKISEGSNNKNDQLELILNGEFKSQKIKDEKILITGFFNGKDGKDFEIISLEINWNNYFDNYQPLNTNESDLAFSSDLTVLKSLLETLKIKFDNYDQVIDLEKIEKIFQFESIQVTKDNGQMIWKFQLKSKFVIFKNGNWEQENEQISFFQKTNNKFAIDLPTLTQLLQHIVNLFTFDDSKLTDYYPSYFYGLFKSSLDSKSDLTGLLNFINSEEIINKYKNKYFPNQDYFAQLVLDESTFKVDDQKGTLSFLITLSNKTSSSNTPVVQTELSTNKLKSIDNFISQDYPEKFTLTDSSRILTIIKNKYQEDIEKVKKDGQKIEKTIPKNLVQTYATIYQFSNNPISSNSSKEFELQLFSRELQIIYANHDEFNTPNSLNLKNGLYTQDTKKPRESFFIEAIQIDSEDQDLPIIFTKENQNVKVEIKTKLKILLVNNLLLEHPLTITKLINS